MKYLAVLALFALVGCKQAQPPTQVINSTGDGNVSINSSEPDARFPEGTAVLRSHVEQCFLGHWTFIDAKGFVTAIDLDGSPFNCERFDGKDVELHYMGKRYLTARVVGGK